MCHVIIICWPCEPYLTCYIDSMKFSIRDILDLGKRRERDIYISLLLLVLATFAFALGRLSKVRSVQIDPVVKSGDDIKLLSGSLLVPGVVVSTKNSKIYYYPWCTAVSRFKPENLRIFKDEPTARSANLSPAKNCAGMNN